MSIYDFQRSIYLSLLSQGERVTVKHAELRGRSGSFEGSFSGVEKEDGREYAIFNSESSEENERTRVYVQSDRGGEFVPARELIPRRQEALTQ
ncbi:hypothetical protein CMI48_03515 [Candidatus Pacearchaeota archaeon]|jgi:hypothetical protein|nr:hypothetical protein [Candidatus Pacearchaeota archaeon]|tara:strand:+ start:475 stop:753 length:279 start_codon:yes stop_codon:yes gene_type:complete